MRGYEYAKDRYVVLSDEELAQANVEASHTINLLAFVKAGELDPMYIERPLWVLPGKSGQRAYQLLVETLTRTGRAGVGQVVLRTRQHLAAVLPRDGRLVLLVLRYAHNLAPPKAVEAPAGPGKKAAPTAAERRMAEQLVESLAGPWKPEEYDDTYFDDVMALVKKKVASGRPTVVTHAKAPASAKGGAKVLDLAALLEKSLAARREGARAKRHRKSA